MKTVLLACAALLVAALFATGAQADDLGGFDQSPLTASPEAFQGDALGDLLEDVLAPTPLTDVELAEERGGLKTPLGEIDFGAVVRTIIDGHVALETELDWTEAGAVQTQALTALQNELNQRGSVHTAALEGKHPSVILGDASGGATTVMHEITSDQIANVVINTASNLDIRLETDITLVIPELAQLQEDLAGQQLELGLHDAIGQALVNAGL